MFLRSMPKIVEQDFSEAMKGSKIKRPVMAYMGK